MAFTILKDNSNNNLSSGIVAIHAALVPTSTTMMGDPAIVYFGTDNEARLFKLGNLTTTPAVLGSHPGGQAFCSSHAFLNDGRWVIAGGVIDQNVTHFGHGLHDSGSRFCDMYSPLAGTFAPIDDLNFQPDGDHGGGRWYPTTLTVGNGEVFVVAGHPFSGKSIPTPGKKPEEWPEDTTGSDDYVYGNDPGPRHNNNTPERYSPVLDKWTQLTAESTSHENDKPDEYPRLHLAPSGHVFFSTLAKENLRFYSPYTGTYDGTSVAGGSSLYHDGSGSDFTSIMLPILPGDTNNIWVLACGASFAEKINIVADAPAWEGAGTTPLGKNRPHLCGVILPTGSILVTGGEVPGGPEIPPAELYHPPIDWDDQKYTSGAGVWETTDTPNVKRGYHFTALLMPDGRVWVGGSTWTDWLQNEHRMEIYTPDYIVPGRVKITKAPPSIGYDAEFDVTLSSNVAISRVVLIRCGSVTHSFDADQRYVVCEFTQSGTNLKVTSPEGWGVAPPGNYMLFVLDSQEVNEHWPGRPCEQAAIIRVCDQECIPVSNRSSYSKLEVDALKDSGVAVFDDAIWLFLENFRPHEANHPIMPALEIRWDGSDGPLMNSNHFRLDVQNAWLEDETLPPDVAQRFAFRYNVRIHEDLFDNVFGERNVFVRWTFEHFECSTVLELTTEPNPFMVDVEGGNPHWLSSDLRVFNVRAKVAPPPGTPALIAGEKPLVYLQRVLAAYQAAPNDGSHPFRNLPKGQESSALELRGKVVQDPVFNFAIAKVRYVAQGVDAEKVRVFFRMFNTVGTMLEFNTKNTYRREGNGPTAVPLLGAIGGKIISIPFFEQPRVTPEQSMTKQPPDQARTIPAAGAAESVMYFGVWLDINQTEEHIPPLIVNDGPFPDDPFTVEPESIKALVRNFHQCLVAEIHFGQDTIPDGGDPSVQIPGTPANSDNLSQRNLAWVPAGNPGSPATRIVQTTFMVRPSGTTPTASLMTPMVVQRRQVLNVRRLRGRGPDELVFDGTKLPAGTRITVYMPDVNIDEVITLAARRASPVKISRLDDHTLSFEIGSAAYLPLPGGRTEAIPGLLSVELPPGIKHGENYRLVVHQLSGSKRRVIGSFQLEVPVFHEPELLEGESIKLSLMRWVFTRIPTNDVWWLIFKRYLGEIEERVRGFGGNPDDIYPSPDGDAYPGGGGTLPGRTLEGKVAKILYDCFGDFKGFILALAGCTTCHEFHSCEPAVERLVHRACAKRLRLAVKVNPADPHKIMGITVLCCGCDCDEPPRLEPVRDVPTTVTPVPVTDPVPRVDPPR